MIESDIKCTSLIDSLGRIGLFLVISSISLASFMIIESVSTISTTVGQTGFSEINTSSPPPLNTNDYNIIGNPFYTENTKSTNTKVSSIDPIPTVEVTYTGNGTINGASSQTIGTIMDKMNNDGSVSSKGQAIILTPSGQVLTYRSESIGTYNPDGSFSDSGIMVFHTPFKMNPTNSTDTTSNTTATLQTQFDNLFGIYKKTVDPDGNGLTKVWKWR
jgi:hypothetical protein